MARRVLLLGGGHAHVQVLQACAREAIVGADLVMVTPYARQIYSGMVPGLIAGHYALDDCVIPLQPLATAAGAQLLIGSAVALDAAARRVQLADGRTVDYELLSIDTGAALDRGRIPGARENALFVRPMEPFIEQLQALLGRNTRRTLEVLVLGGGAAGVELTLALDHRYNAGAAQPLANLTLLTGGAKPLATHAAGVRKRVARVLAQQRVNVLQETCTALGERMAHLGSGAKLACDVAIVATGAEAPQWLAGSGLVLDDKGFVLTGETLQSVSHANVFAVGDVATRRDAPHPKSGVYAVRAGPPLAANLRSAVESGELQNYTPQAHALNLLACGERQAIASWGPLSAQGAWVWRWKDRIDREFIAKYAVKEASKAAPKVRAADAPPTRGA
jgi:pyridine nucleotide-disulfide oxidoreductase family protein